MRLEKQFLLKPQQQQRRKLQSDTDRAAAERAMAFSLHWFADPIYGDGKYPEIMRTVCGDRLPTFTAEESEQVRGSSDFFGLNSYSTHLAAAPGLRSSIAALGPALKQIGLLGFLKNAVNF